MHCGAYAMVRRHKEQAMEPTGNSYPLGKDDAHWKQQLTEQEYHVLRQGGTEPPGSGEYTSTKTMGVYQCRACNTELFRSDQKFDSGCGWPSFWGPLAKERVEYLRDDSTGSPRIEVRCTGCGSHLGHVFQGEGFDTPTDLRYCINSVCLTLEEVDIPSARPPAADSD